MKNISRNTTSLLIALLSLYLYACSSGPKPLTVEGRLSGGDGNMIYLHELTVTNTKPIDSTEISKNGKFSFETQITNPKFFIVATAPNNFITLYGDSAETITLDASYKHFATDYTVTGSENSILIKRLNRHLQRTKAELDSLAQISNKLTDQSRIDEINIKFKEVIDNQTNFSLKFLEENPFSMSSVVALYQRYDNGTYVVQNMQKMKTAATALSVMYPESEHAKALVQNTLQIIKNEQNQRISSIIDQYGSNSPDIALPNESGKEIKLSSIDAKYKLIQFWSAKDRGSRILNKSLVNNYKKYKSKGFDIYQVSIDNDRVAWLTAIKLDKLTWTNVGDMEGSNDAVSKYNVRSLPYNYLLDPKGEIIAKNLKGPELGKVLKKLLD